jgi:hypothetical protein
MGLKKSFKIPKDVVNVIAQTKQSLEDTTYPDTNINQFKEMVRAPKKKKKIESKGLDSKTF